MRLSPPVSGLARAGGELQRCDPAAGERDDADDADGGGAIVAYPQSTLEEIVASERSMFLDGESRYGRHFQHARAATMYLSLCVVMVEQDRSDTFGRLFSLTKKYHTLAFLSALRLHKVQAMLNLRQVLEAGAGAAYAIAHPDIRGFADIDAFGIMDPSQKLATKRYRWLDENYPDNSKRIVEIKDQINSQTAHANIVSADATFRESADVVDLPFFDTEHKDLVQADLRMISGAAISLMDLFYGVTKKTALAIGRPVVEFRPDFSYAIAVLVAQNNALLDEIMGSHFFKSAMRKEEQRSEARAKLPATPLRPRHPARHQIQRSPER